MLRRRLPFTRRHVAFLFVALLAFAFFAPGRDVFAQPDTAAGPVPAGLWKLTPASNFVEGCFDPCMCPVLFHEALFGTLRMTPAPADAGFAVYDVTDLNWLVKGFEYWVTGSGTYRIGGQPLMHRLTLDLKVGDRVVEHYDSGLTPVGASTNAPEITIGISKNNLVCHDTLFSVTMRPLVAQEIATYGLRQSRYEEGCFGPCDCAVRAWPFIGRLGLVRLDGNGWGVGASTPADFGIVDLRGSVLDPATATANSGRPVLGGGLYHVDAATGRQQLRLDLLENGAGPTRFDSGEVAWGGDLKRIDADVAANGFACNDRVYAIDARRKPRSDLATESIRPDPYHPGAIPVP
ncbi:MAG TPA: hypothetical protein VMQ62_13840 [Dongiaceae bacterium]|nr:hypothetical protein [Dongiaceae bacterium]